MILQPLQKIRVVKSTKKCKPGSLGYAIFQEKINGYNMWGIDVLFTRFGKKGKPRLELMSVSQYIVNPASLKKAEAEIIEVVKVDEGLYPRAILPGTSRSYRQKHEWMIGTLDTEIELDSYPNKYLVDLPIHEFIAYVMAHSLLLYNFLNGGSILTTVLGGSLSQASEAPMQDYPNDCMGYYILAGLKQDTRNKTHDYATRIENYFLSMDNRMEWIIKLRKNLAMIRTAYARHTRHKNSTVTDEKHRIDETVKYYLNHKREFKDLIKLNEERKENPWASSYGSRKTPKAKFKVNRETGRIYKVAAH